MNKKRSLENIILSINNLLETARNEKVKLPTGKILPLKTEKKESLIESEEKIEDVLNSKSYNTSIKFDKLEAKKNLKNFKKNEKYDWNKHKYFNKVYNNVGIQELEKITEKVFRKEMLKWSNQKLNTLIKIKIKNKTNALLE